MTSRSRRRQAAHRLHVAAVLALRAAHRGSEHRVLWRHLRSRRRSASRARRDFVLEMAGLKGRETTLARDLAGGWRQRLALGCAILHEPTILFLDEPTGGVDPLSRRQFWRLIDVLSHAGVTVLVTTHYLDEAERCHRVALIHAGRLATHRHANRSQAGLRRPADSRDPRSESGRGDARARRDAGGGEDQPVRHGRPRRAAFAPRSTPPTIEQRLRAAGLPVQSLEPVPPSLEDVFLDVVRKRRRRRHDEERWPSCRKELRQIRRDQPHADDPRLRPGVLPAAVRLRAELRHPPRRAGGRGPRRHAPRAARVVSAFVNSGYFDLVAAVYSPRRRSGCSICNTARAVLVIPEGFGRRRPAGDTSPLQVIISGDNANTATTVMGYAGSILRGVSAQLGPETRVAAPPLVPIGAAHLVQPRAAQHAVPRAGPHRLHRDDHRR